MTEHEQQIQKFELLAQCYRSDLQRLDGIKEAAWYFAQLHSIDGGEDYDFQTLMDECDKETMRVRRNLPDLEDLIREMKENGPGSDEGEGTLPVA